MSTVSNQKFIKQWKEDKLTDVTHLTSSLSQTRREVQAAREDNKAAPLAPPSPFSMKP